MATSASATDMATWVAASVIATRSAGPSRAPVPARWTASTVLEWPGVRA